MCSGSSDGYVKFCLSLMHAEMEEGKASITEGEQSKPEKKNDTEYESTVDKETVVTSLSYIKNDLNTFGLGNLNCINLVVPTNARTHSALLNMPPIMFKKCPLIWKSRLQVNFSFPNT